MLNEIEYYIQTFINLFSDIHINLYIFLATAIIFLVLHNLRDKPIIKSISVYVSFFPVLIHELGHAFAAQLTGGHVQDIHMVMSAKKQEATGKQGYAVTGSKNRVTSAIVAFFGYVSAPLMLFIGVYLIKHDLTFIFVFIIFVFTIFYLTHTKQLWIPIAIVFILGYSIYTMYTSNNAYMTLSIDTIYNILLGLLLGEIIQSIIITTKTLFSNGNPEWDGSSLKKLTMIPELFWWAIWTFISFFSIYQTYQLLIT